MKAVKSLSIQNKEFQNISLVTGLVWFVLLAWAAGVDYLYAKDYYLPNFQTLVPLGFREASPDQLLDRFLWPWFRWDTERYLEIAIHGYIDKTNVAFAPLYPLAVRVFGTLFLGRYLLAAIFLSVTTTLMSTWLIYLDTKNIFNGRIALRTVFFFLIFPSAFFLFGAYSEGMFLLFTLMSWRSSSKNQWLHSSLWVSLAVLTRFQGLGLFVPLAYRWWKLSNRRLQNGGLYLLSVPIVFFAWAVFSHQVLGAPYPWQALDAGWKLHFGWPWEGILTNLLLIFNIHPSWKLQPFLQIHLFTLFLDLFSTILFVVLTIYVYKKLPLEYCLLMIVLLLPALMKINHQGTLISVIRYVLTLWPGFVVLAIFGENNNFRRFWFFLSVLLGFLASALFFLDKWIA